MSDKELEEYIRTIEPNFDNHIEKGTIEMNNEYYNLLEERMARLINENQELKADYGNKSQVERDLLLEENSKLKKQLKNVEKTFRKQHEEDSNRINCCLKKEFKNSNQQKEFVKWLESMLDNDIDIFSVVRVKDVLSKYKEIIGDDK